MIGVVGVIPTRTIPDSAPELGSFLLDTPIPTFWLAERLKEAAQKSRFRGLAGRPPDLDECFCIISFLEA